jgi:hypothetical protein
VAKQTGLGDRLIVGGYNLSGDIGSLESISGSVAPLPDADITQSGEDRLWGRRDGNIAFTAFFDKASSRAHPVLSALPRTSAVTSYLRGATLGNPAASHVAKQIDYAGSRGADGSLTFNVATQASDGYWLDWGRQLTAGERTDTTGTNGTGVDGAASSSFGAQFYLHVTGLTGTNVVVTIQDSADNSSWANLSGAAFTSKTAIGDQRIAVTGTVRRYLRAVSSGTFSSATFVVNAARNAAAVPS